MDLSAATLSKLLGVRVAVSSLPNAFVSKFLKVVSRPEHPNVALTKRVAHEVLQDKMVRDRMTAWCYFPKDDSNPVKVLFDAFELMQSTKSIRKMIKESSVK